MPHLIMFIVGSVLFLGLLSTACVVLHVMQSYTLIHTYDEQWDYVGNKYTPFYTFKYGRTLFKIQYHTGYKDDSKCGEEFLLFMSPTGALLKVRHVTIIRYIVLCSLSCILYVTLGFLFQSSLAPFLLYTIVTSILCILVVKTYRSIRQLRNDIKVIGDVEAYERFAGMQYRSYFDNKWYIILRVVFLIILLVSLVLLYYDGDFISTNETFQMCDNALIPEMYPRAVKHLSISISDMMDYVIGATDKSAELLEVEYLRALLDFRFSMVLMLYNIVYAYIFIPSRYRRWRIAERMCIRYLNQ